MGRLIFLLTLMLLAGCADLHVATVSPDDPAYNETGAPGAANFVPGNGPRPYRPLGPAGPD